MTSVDDCTGAIDEVETFDSGVFRATEDKSTGGIESTRIQGSIMRPLRNDVREFRIESFG